MEKGHHRQHGDPVGARKRVSVEVYRQPGTEYELRVTDASTGAVVGTDTKYRGSDRWCDVVSFQPTPWGQYEVRLKTKGEAGTFHLSILGGGLATATAPGSVAFPADDATVVAVGAANADGVRAGYSSCGPNSKHGKPDFVAPVPFPSLWAKSRFRARRPPPRRPPALAALCWSQHAEWTAHQVRQTLEKSAHDVGAPGFDFETGFGLIAMPVPELAKR